VIPLEINTPTELDVAISEKLIKQEIKAVPSTQNSRSVVIIKANGLESDLPYYCTDETEAENLLKLLRNKHPHIVIEQQIGGG
jgi:hypothetical protein